MLGVGDVKNGSVSMSGNVCRTIVASPSSSDGASSDSDSRGGFAGDRSLGSGSSSPSSKVSSSLPFDTAEMEEPDPWLLPPSEVAAERVLLKESDFSDADRCNAGDLVLPWSKEWTLSERCELMLS